ncbi:FHA domain-containing protein [Microbacterium sp. NPDC090007]|uniref:FHA domain-containing protein n=1 Tax=Microbacterium sp. NPDC090007 TaxID=3364204 RepID=UPI0037F966A3
MLVLSLIAAIAAALLVPALALHVWYAIGLSRVLDARGAERWRAWVPLVNDAEIFRLGGIDPVRAVLLVVPVVNIYALVLKARAAHRLGTAVGRGAGTAALALLFPPVWAQVLTAPERATDAELPAPGPQRRSEMSAPPAPAGPITAVPGTVAAAAGARAASVEPVVAPAPVVLPGPVEIVPTRPAPENEPSEDAPSEDAPSQDATAAAVPSVGRAPSAGLPADADSASVRLPADVDSTSVRRAPSPDAAELPADLENTSLRRTPQTAPASAAASAPLSEGADVPTRRLPRTAATELSADLEATSLRRTPQTAPAQPTAPVGPAASVGPAAHVEPSASVAPSAPVEPSAPVAPSALVEPSASAGTHGTPAMTQRPIDAAAATPAPTADRVDETTDSTDTTAGAGAGESAAPVEEQTQTVRPRSRRRGEWTLDLPDGTRVPLTSRVVLLGRKPVASSESVQAVPIADHTRTVSKQHARLEWTVTGWAVTDLDSTNGVTLVHDDGRTERIAAGSTAIAPGRFRLGDAHFELRPAASS